MSQFPLLRLPLELRIKIYQYILTSNLSFDRSVVVDSAILRIGCFRRDAVLPLLLANQQIHMEAASVLYGTNTFALHMSGVDSEPLAFFESLPVKYVRMLRKVYVCTMHAPVDWHTQNNPQSLEEDRATVEGKNLLLRRDIAISTALVKQAWPKHFNVHINSQSVVSLCGLHGSEDVKTLWPLDCTGAYSSFGWHFWKMTSMNPDSEIPHMEFRRIVWDAPSVMQQSDIAAI